MTAPNIEEIRKRTQQAVENQKRLREKVSAASREIQGESEPEQATPELLES